LETILSPRAKSWQNVIETINFKDTGMQVSTEKVINAYNITAGKL
jgi:hypothetical protein